MIALACFVGFIIGAALAGWYCTRHDTIFTTIGADGGFAFTFTTADRGRTWRYRGATLPASPLTDRLQDAWDNVRLNRPVAWHRDGGSEFRFPNVRGR
jgi:hypothetical protein